VAGFDEAAPWTVVEKSRSAAAMATDNKITGDTSRLDGI